MLKHLLVALAFVSSNVLALPITAQSWIVTTGDGTIINGANTNELRSIASISKLVTAMVVLDANQNLKEHISGSTRGDLLQLSLVKSNNAATDQLCNAYPGGRHECIVAMNRKMQSLGLVNTRFVEPKD